MKTFLALLFFCGSVLFAVDAPAPSPALPVDDYGAFLAQCAKRENVVECIAVMDRLITAGEHGLVDKELAQGLAADTTKFGLHIEFSATDAAEAIVYYLKISREGKPLRYDEAAKFAALFTDRAGLPHPVNIQEGDKFAFYAHWLIKPSDWKAMLKMMKKAREEYRAEKDPAKVFLHAVDRELDARSQAQRTH